MIISYDNKLTSSLIPYWKFLHGLSANPAPVYGLAFSPLLTQSLVSSGFKRAIRELGAKKLVDSFVSFGGFSKLLDGVNKSPKKCLAETNDTFLKSGCN